MSCCGTRRASASSPRRPGGRSRCPGTSPVNLYKNNTDNKGVSYGCHENYLMSRSTSFADMIRHLTPFFVSRQVVAGPAGSASAPTAASDGFQLSQRADFFEVEVGLETTLKRPIINTRDEPHADPEKYRRLHVIIGDANMSELSTYLKLGTHVAGHRHDRGRLAGATDLSLEAPVATLRAISHDPTLRQQVILRDGRKMTAVQLQMEYLDQARKFVEDRWGSDADEQTRDVLTRWESTLVRLEAEPMSLSRELDWVAKLAILEGYRERDGAGLELAAAAAGRPAVQRRAPGQGFVQPAGRDRPVRATAIRGRGRARDGRAPGGHPGVLPRTLPGQVRERGLRGVLGFGDLRCRP